jgi:AAA domain
MVNTFDFLSPGGQPVFVTRLPNERGKGKIISHYVKNETELRGFINRNDEPGQALYYAAATLKEGSWRNKENVVAVRKIWAEIDFKQHPDIERLEIRRRIEAIPLPPSAVVFSGHGYHLYWLLKEDADAAPGDGQRRVEDALKLAAAYVGGDIQVAETARLMRLPGSHNTRMPGEELAVVFDGLEMTRVYDLEDLVDFWLEAQPILPTPGANKASGNGHDTSGFDFEKSGPVDSDTELDAIRDGASANDIQCRVIPSLIWKAWHPDEIVRFVVDGTMQAAERAGLGWDRATEVRHVVARVLSAYHNMFERDYDASTGAIPVWLPGEFHETWTRILVEGRCPTIMRNGAGFHVRRKQETGAEDAGGTSSASGSGDGADDGGGPGPEEREEKPQEKRRRIHLLPYDAPDRTQIPRRSWLYGFHYMRRIVSATVGPGGIGKSSLGLIEGVGMSIGRDLFGKEELEEPLRLWYHNGEDPRDEVNRRIAAICIRFGVDEQEVRKNMFVTCGLDMPIKVARGTTEVKLDKVLRADIIGANWIGKPLGAQLALNPENKVDRARIKRVVAKLVEEGTLRVVERLDEKGRQQRNFLAAGTTYG